MTESPLIVSLKGQLAVLDEKSDTSFGFSVSAALRGVQEAAGHIEAATERLLGAIEQRERLAAAITVLQDAETNGLPS